MYTVHSKTILHLLALALLSPFFSLAQPVKLLPNDGAESQQFGESVALSGDGKYIIVGADGDEEHGDNAGSAYIYQREGKSYKQVAKLVSHDIAPGDFFGSVALSANGHWALVGAWGDDDDGGASGSVYVFKRSNDVWIEQAKLTANDAATTDNFGSAVAISATGEYALIGAPRNDDGANDAGSAYVFKRTANIWTQQAKLVTSDPAASRLFGYVLTLSLDGSYALFGVENDEENGMWSGSAYVFFRDGSIWKEQKKLVPHDGAVQDFFGRSVAMNADGSAVLIGADGDDDNGNSSGSVYPFRRQGGAWVEGPKIQASDPAVGDLFGTAVSLSADGKHAIISAPRDDDGADAAGSVYYFEWTGNQWTEQLKLTEPDPGVENRLGESIAISADGTFAVAGCEFDSSQGINAGSAYAFGGNTLPVELTSFTAASSNNRVLLQWETASELNNAGFHIEQFSNAEWIDIGFVAGVGTINDPQFYSYTVPNLPPGHYQFRLKQVDFDGTATYSPERAVTVGVQGGYDLRLVGPHPVRNQASWVLTLPTSQSIDVNVYDLVGRQVGALYTGYLGAETPLRLSWGAYNAAPGMYIIVVEGERFRSTKKFVLL